MTKCIQCTVHVRTGVDLGISHRLTYIKDLLFIKSLFLHEQKEDGLTRNSETRHQPFLKEEGFAQKNIDFLINNIVPHRVNQRCPRFAVLLDNN